LNRLGKDTERRRLPRPTIAEEAEREEDRVTAEFVRGRPMEGRVAWVRQRKPRDAMWEQRPVTARSVRLGWNLPVGACESPIARPQASCRKSLDTLCFLPDEANERMLAQLALPRSDRRRSAALAWRTQVRACQMAAFWRPHFSPGSLRVSVRPNCAQCCARWMLPCTSQVSRLLSAVSVHQRRRKLQRSKLFVEFWPRVWCDSVHGLAGEIRSRPGVRFSMVWSDLSQCGAFFGCPPVSWPRVSVSQNATKLDSLLC
jgi:hypothetical protein